MGKKVKKRSSTVSGRYYAIRVTTLPRQYLSFTIAYSTRAGLNFFAGQTLDTPETERLLSKRILKFDSMLVAFKIDLANSPLISTMIISLSPGLAKLVNQNRNHSTDAEIAPNKLERQNLLTLVRLVASLKILTCTVDLSQLKPSLSRYPFSSLPLRGNDEIMVECKKTPTTFTR